MAHRQALIEFCTEEEKRRSHLRSEYQDRITLSENKTYCAHKSQASAVVNAR